HRVRLRETGGSGLSSAAVDAPLVELQPAALCQFAERGAAAVPIDAPESAPVRLLFRALKPLNVAEALLSSALPAVRVWAVRRAVQLTTEAEPLLWRALRDTEPRVRRLAVEGLLVGSPPRDRVLRLFEELAHAPAEDG